VTVLAVIALSMVFGFLLFGGMVWLQFHDARKGADGLTPGDRIREQDRRFKDRLNYTKAVWSKDVDKLDLAERQEAEWRERRQF